MHNVASLPLCLLVGALWSIKGTTAMTPHYALIFMPFGRHPTNERAEFSLLD